MTSAADEKEVLLVGEGNFSYSSAISCVIATESDDITKVTNDITRRKYWRITATCPQTREEALLHNGCGQNIQSITHAGGEVLFEVDCTRLSDCLRGQQFDRVIFNFPHCGRKSGVKKNRLLLKHFFLSCVEVLKEDGEVHVSLCNGQGGTPADQPMREWQNSWQVIAMAAEAGLILNEVRPFDWEKLEGYQSTGYRSQDKCFHAELGLTHVFSLGVPFSAPKRKEMTQHTPGQDTLTYHIPAELSNYIDRGFLCSSSVHPVRLVQDFLVQALEREWLVSIVSQPLPLLVSSSPQRLKACCPDILDTHTHCYWLHPTHKPSEGAGNTQTLVDIRTDTHIGCPTGGEEEDGEGYLLRPSLLPQMEKVLKDKVNQTEEREEVLKDKVNQTKQGEERKEVLYGASALVLQRVPISPWALPAFHQLLLRGPGSKTSQSVPLGQSLKHLLAPYGVSQANEQGLVWLTAEPMGRLGWLCADGVTGDITACLNLDLLASLLYSIPDCRLLWSHDRRFLNHFLLRPLPGQPFRSFSLFPLSFVFDISFWAGPDWQEAEFHALVRKASGETVVDMSLVDTYSPDIHTCTPTTHPDTCTPTTHPDTCTPTTHPDTCTPTTHPDTCTPTTHPDTCTPTTHPGTCTPTTHPDTCTPTTHPDTCTPTTHPHTCTPDTHTDLRRISYCYRLTYRSHIYALSHTRALTLHTQLQSLLATQMHLIVR